MALLLDLFGFLSVVLRGLTITAQSLTIGGILFLSLVAWPFRKALGDAGGEILTRCRRVAGWSAVGFAVMAFLSALIEAAILADTVGLSFGETIGAGFVRDAATIILAAAAIAVICLRQPPRRWEAWVLPLLAAVVLVAQTMTSHAASRLDDRIPLAAAELLHQAAAAAWIGGIPYLLIAQGRCREQASWRRVGKRFSHISLVSVAVLVTAGLVMAVAYTGSVDAIYGTAYGVMLSTKVLLLGFLLLLGGMNYLIIEHLVQGSTVPMLRMRRFGEVEIGIGFTLFFAAASLTSLPPASDLVNDRVSLHEIAERMTPHWPRLESPSHADLAIPMLQEKLDAEAASSTRHAEAFVPGAGEIPPRNAEDIAWSEYNHHWSGLAVLLIGLLALAERSGMAPWARNWPLVFLALALFLFLRSDPETWPLGDIGLIESLRDPEVVQHRIFVALIIGFGIFEWRVRTKRSKSPRAALVFPMITAVGGALLLTHSHALSNLKDQLLIEMTHVPLALCGILAGWARWLELRLDPPASRVAAWVWPICLTLVGILLILYREA
ncbi:MAG: copper resistance protein [Rhodospirillales bacterium]|nr:copper resistance protein [Rhodospirillales bacterium]